MPICYTFPNTALPHMQEHKCIICDGMQGVGKITAGKLQLWEHIKCVENIRMKILHFVHTKKNGIMKIYFNL
jgi:hypothetical protein